MPRTCRGDDTRGVHGGTVKTHCLGAAAALFFALFRAGLGLGEGLGEGEALFFRTGGDFLGVLRVEVAPIVCKCLRCLHVSIWSTRVYLVYKCLYCIVYKCLSVCARETFSYSNRSQQGSNRMAVFSNTDCTESNLNLSSSRDFLSYGTCVHCYPECGTQVRPRGCIAR
jgi:hypothetical protein